MTLTPVSGRGMSVRENVRRVVRGRDEGTSEWGADVGSEGFKCGEGENGGPTSFEVRARWWG